MSKDFRGANNSDVVQQTNFTAVGFHQLPVAIVLMHWYCVLVCCLTIRWENQSVNVWSLIAGPVHCPVLPLLSIIRQNLSPVMSRVMWRTDPRYVIRRQSAVAAAAVARAVGRCEINNVQRRRRRRATIWSPSATRRRYIYDI